MISYEMPLGLGFWAWCCWRARCGSMRSSAQQAQSGVWNVFVQPLGFVVFVVAASAEAARLPFDLPEAEQELIGGYHTEYSGMKLLMYLIAEFLHMVTAAFLIVILFLGGWHLWGLTGCRAIEVTWAMAILRIVVLVAKVLGVILFFMIVRWSWPRFRFDQLMALAWKVMLPLGLVNLVVAAVLVGISVPIARRIRHRSDLLVPIIVSWGVALAAWVAGGLLAPLATDNPPRRSGCATASLNDDVR